MDNALIGGGGCTYDGAAAQAATTVFFVMGACEVGLLTRVAVSTLS